MWDEPQRMNALANVLLVLATALAAYLALTVLVRQPLFALREVRIEGELAHVTRAEIEAVVRGELRGNFFTLDLTQARAAFGRLPWVRQVAARRHWPGRLEVTLEEHRPLARWSDLALVNTHGEVFEAQYEGALPAFAGPDGSAKEIAIQYAYFQRVLQAIGRAPVQVSVTARRSWRVKLDNGLTLALGRDNLESRLGSFVAVYESTIERMQRRLDYVDLRYPNGFAVRVPELVRPERKARGVSG